MSVGIEHDARTIDSTLDGDAIVIPADQPDSHDPAPKDPVAARFSGIRTRFEPVWRDWRMGTAEAIGAGGMWGLVAGWWTPRGPLISSHALWSIVISLAVGWAAGLAMRSRLVMLVAPVAFGSVFELTRRGTDGPTVDGVETSFYGLLALGVGRGFHGLLSLFPMMLGATAGAGFARRLSAAEIVISRRAVGRHVRRVVAVLAAVGLVMLTAGLARPAHTDPIVDANGDLRPVSG